MNVTYFSNQDASTFLQSKLLLDCQTDVNKQLKCPANFLKYYNLLRLSLLYTLLNLMVLETKEFSSTDEKSSRQSLYGFPSFFSIVFFNISVLKSFSYANWL